MKVGYAGVYITRTCFPDVKTGVWWVILIFFIYDPKNRLWVLVCPLGTCIPTIYVLRNSKNQRTNGPINAHLRHEIYTCTNKLVRLEWYNACI